MAKFISTCYNYNMKTRDINPDLALLKEYMQYDSTSRTGLRWIKALPTKFTIVGKEVGGLMNTGYYGFYLFKKHYLVHRVIMLLVNGSVNNDLIIDHIDNDRSNNNIDNLREVDMSVNVWKVKKGKNNRSGMTGVAYNKLNSNWRVKLMCRGNAIEVGSFKTFEEAVEARIEAEKKLHENNLTIN